MNKNTLFLKLSTKKVGLSEAWLLACWDCGFESRRGLGCLSLVSVVFCQVDRSGQVRSLVQRFRAECGVSECDRIAEIMRRPWPTRGCCSMGRGCEEVGLEVSTGKTEYTFMSRQQNVRYYHDTKLENIGGSRLLGCYAVSPAKYLLMFPRI
jgi:hypothetical protein